MSSTVSFPRRRSPVAAALAPEDILRALRTRNPAKYARATRYLTFLWDDECEAERRTSLPFPTTPRDEVS
jgi:hypothetical protein